MNCWCKQHKQLEVCFPCWFCTRMWPNVNTQITPLHIYNNRAKSIMYYVNYIIRPNRVILHGALSSHVTHTHTHRSYTKHYLCLKTHYTYLINKLKMKHKEKSWAYAYRLSKISFINRYFLIIQNIIWFSINKLAEILHL